MAVESAATGWIAGMVRFTGFVPVPPRLASGEVFQSIFGEAPEKETKSAKELVASAEIGGARLRRLDIKANRIDILIVAQKTEENALDLEFPSLGEAHAQISRICDLGASFAKHVGAFDRIAIGSVCLLPVEGREAAYSLLKNYLNLPYLDPAVYADFQMRINRPIDREIDTHKVRINCMSTWSALALNFGVSANQHVPAKLTTVRHALHAELDINTAADSNLSESKPQISAAGILAELGKGAVALLGQGPAK